MPLPKDETTPPAPTVTDIDGNVYQTVTIGSQVWMADNLATTRFNDGTSIPQVKNDTAWGSLLTPAYCWYFNDGVTYKYSYGALYNWYAVNTGKLAPAGWHVPTDDEWTILFTYMGGDSIAGGKMKSMSSLWHTPNTGATNSSGFSAAPGGYRNSYDGSFYLYTMFGVWWSSTEIYDNASSYHTLGYNSTKVTHGMNMQSTGYSVRCVKN